LIVDTKEFNTINLHEIPAGKQSFIGEVKEIDEKIECDYHGNIIYAPYVFITILQVLIDKTWFKVNCSGNSVKSKIGKKLEKLCLESGDTLTFNALVENAEIEFLYIEGKDDIDIDEDEIYCDPYAILPKSYNGVIRAEVYETEFTAYERVFKNNYVEYFDRSILSKKIKKLNYSRKAMNGQNGYFREIQGLYFDGKNIKRLSNIEKY